LIIIDYFYKILKNICEKTSTKIPLNMGGFATKFNNHNKITKVEIEKKSTHYIYRFQMEEIG
jgi:hypothetical protein